MELVRNADINLLIRFVLVLFLLYIMTREDLKDRELTLRWIVIFALAGFAFELLSDSRDIAGMLSGAGIGAVMVALSAITSGGIGLGDGLVVIAVGFTLGFSATFAVVMTSFLAAALYALFLTVVKKKSKKTRYPYMPFLFFSYVGMLPLL